MNTPNVYGDGVSRYKTKSVVPTNIVRTSSGIDTTYDKLCDWRYKYVLLPDIGLAGRLAGWASSLADELQVLVYLDTASDNPAARLYRRLGFEEQGRNTIEDLGKYASIAEIRKLSCDIRHTHVAFLRFPQNPDNLNA